jgi:hypothetical protein
MADRTSARICGNIINILDGFGAPTEIVQMVWGEFMDYDFSPYQTELPMSMLKKYRICSYCGGTSEWPCCNDEEVDTEQHDPLNCNQTNE